MTGLCHQSENVICKHAGASRTFYVALDNRLAPGVTITAAVAETDSSIQIVLVQVLQDDLTIVDGTACTETTLPADRTILIRLAGGTESDDEQVVTVTWTQSDGDEDAVDLRILIGGANGS